MRLFAALELNSKAVANLVELIRRLRPVAPIRWVHPQNVHLTLKYIGEYPEHRLEHVVRALSQVKLTQPLLVPLAGLGYFPNAQNPKIMWAGAENTPGLRQLASQVDAALQPLGVAPDVRPFQPHLTLGRIIEDEPLEEMHKAVEDLPSREFGLLSPESFSLFETALTPEGAIHRRVADFPFLALPAEPAGAGRAQLAGRV
jgi:RNA 2',3'-cyclic 3'-phosphodiesterase